MIVDGSFGSNLLPQQPLTIMRRLIGAKGSLPVAEASENEMKHMVTSAVSQQEVTNGKCETLRDGETGVFLCEPETF